MQDLDNVSDWHKSSYSGSDPHCVEMGTTQTKVAIRDTKDRKIGTMTFSPESWDSFVKFTAKS